MGLEVATYVSQLVPTNPVVGDDVSQGDDHLRLLKSVLQATLPNASKPFYLPTSTAEETSTVNVASPGDNGQTIPISTAGGAITVNLPAAPADMFSVTLVKTTSDANAVSIVPSGANINGETSLTLVNVYESITCVYLSTFAGWVGLRSPKGSPFDSLQAASKIWAIANGGTGQDTAYEAFDALSVARVDVASTATPDLDAAQSSYVRITGTTTITGFTLTAGRKRWVVFSGALTLTNGASLILPGAANITTIAGDTALLVGESGGVVRCLQYLRVTPKPYQLPARAYQSYATNTSITTLIDRDDTLPENTEGTEILSASITLTRSNSRVRLRFQGWGTYLSGANDDGLCWIAAMFDPNGDCIAAGASGPSVSNAISSNFPPTSNVVLEVEVAPGTVGPHTYTVRVGKASSGGVEIVSGTFRMNGSSSARWFGGAAAATLTVEEVFI